MARITLNPPDAGTPDLCASCNEVNEMRDSQEGRSLFLGLLPAHKKKPGYTDRAFLGKQLTAAANCKHQRESLPNYQSFQP